MSKRIPIFIGFLLVCLAIWIIITPNRIVRNAMDELENIGYDVQLKTRVLTENKSPTTPIAIVDIDDKSLKAEGRWPWPRGKLAELVTQLQKQGAAVIAFDMFFGEKQPNIAKSLMEELRKRNLLNPLLEETLEKNISLFDEDSQFAKSLETTQAVLALGFLPRPQTQNILPPPLIQLSEEDQTQLQLIRATGYISNIPILQNAGKGAGFLNIFPDSDGIIRHSPLIIEYKGGLYPALSLQAVLTYLGEKIQLVTALYHTTKQLEGLKLGASIIPTDAKGQVLIPFIGRSYTFPFYSATDVMHENIPKDVLLGKIIFIGTSATGSGDLKATAIQSPFPGVEIQATLANGLLLNNFSYKPAWTLGANIVIAVLIGLLSAFLFPYFGPRTLSILIVLVPPALLFLNNWVWAKTGLILSLVIPMALVLVIAIFNIIYGYLFETRKRERLKEMFGQYVPEKHIDEMLKSTGNYALRGEDREMTVLFADIRHFTSISENMSATEIVEMLNTFFTPMTETIFKNRGTIDKYVGDLIMAFWSAPLKDKYHARHALQSALEMQAKVKQLRKLWAERKWPEIKMGIGINSGIMSVGDMGSRYRRNYTVLGDEVNLASRIESLTKFYGVGIIVTEKVQHGQTRFIFRRLDRVRVKGRKLGVVIYELICFHSELTPELSRELELYHKALDLYLDQKWDDALVLFNQLKLTYPDKKIYQIYVKRVNEFKINPPPKDWDGIYAHESK